MFTKQKKLNKMLIRIQAMISPLIIAFFFSTFFIFVIFLLFGSEIDYGLSLVNTLSLKMIYGDNGTPEYDPIQKHLVNKPSWGLEFGVIKIPSVEIELPLYHGDDYPQLAAGVGHYPGSYFPGEGGSIVFAGHNDRGKFYTLPRINIGDIITLETTYGTFEYKVFQTAIEDYRNNEAFPIQHDYELLMLYTCYPVDNIWYVNDRFIVYAKLVGDES